MFDLMLLRLDAGQAQVICATLDGDAVDVGRLLYEGQAEGVLSEIIELANEHDMTTEWLLRSLDGRGLMLAKRPGVLGDPLQWAARIAEEIVVRSHRGSAPHGQPNTPWRPTPDQ